MLDVGYGVGLWHISRSVPHGQRCKKSREFLTKTRGGFPVSRESLAVMGVAVLGAAVFAILHPYLWVTFLLGCLVGWVMGLLDHDDSDPPQMRFG